MELIKPGDLIELKFSEWTVCVVDSVSDNKLKATIDGVPSEFSMLQNSKLAYFRKNTELEQGCSKLLFSYNFMDFDLVTNTLNSFINSLLDCQKPYKIYQFLRGRLYFFLIQAFQCIDFSQRFDLIAGMIGILQLSLDLVKKIFMLPEVKFIEGSFHEKMNVFEAFGTAFPELLEILKIAIGENQKSEEFFMKFVNNPQYCNSPSDYVQNTFISKFFSKFNIQVMENLLGNCSLKFIFGLSMFFKEDIVKNHQKYTGLIADISVRRLKNPVASSLKSYECANSEFFLKKLTPCISDFNYTELIIPLHIRALAELISFRSKLEVVSSINNLMNFSLSETLIRSILKEKYHLVITQHPEFLRNSTNFFNQIRPLGNFYEIVTEIIDFTNEDLVLNELLLVLKGFLNVFPEVEANKITETVILKCNFQNLEVLTEFLRENLRFHKKFYNNVLCFILKNSKIKRDPINLFISIIDSPEFEELKAIIVRDKFAAITDENWSEVVLKIFEKSSFFYFFPKENIMSKLIAILPQDPLKVMKMIKCVAFGSEPTSFADHQQIIQILDCIANDEASVQVFLEIIEKKTFDENIKSVVYHSSIKITSKTACRSFCQVFIKLFLKANSHSMVGLKERKEVEFHCETLLMTVYCSGKIGPESEKILKRLIVGINFRFFSDYEKMKKTLSDFYYSFFIYPINKVIRLMYSFFKRLGSVTVEKNEAMISQNNSFKLKDIERFSEDIMVNHAAKISEAWVSDDKNNKKFLFILNFILQETNSVGFNFDQICENLLKPNNDYKVLYVLYILEKHPQLLKDCKVASVFGSYLSQFTQIKLPKIYQLIAAIYQKRETNFFFTEGYLKDLVSTLLDIDCKELDTRIDLNQTVTECIYSSQGLNQSLLEKCLAVLLRGYLKKEIIDVYGLLQKAAEEKAFTSITASSFVETIIISNDLPKDHKRLLYKILSNLESESLFNIQKYVLLEISNQSDQSFESENRKLLQLFWLLSKSRKAVYSNKSHNYPNSKLQQQSITSILNASLFECKSPGPQSKAYPTRSLAYKCILKSQDSIQSVISIFTSFISTLHTSPYKLSSYSSQITSFPKGLKNFGATCYMNSIFQLLYSIPPIRNLILLHPTASGETISSIQYIFQKLHSTVLASVRSSRFVSSFTDFEGLRVNPNEQKDAEEFLQCLILKLEAEGLNDITESITGELTASIQCTICQKVSKNCEKFLSLPLQVKDCATLEQCFEVFNRVEVLDQQNQYFCENCNLKVKAFKLTQISSVPKYLLITLKRFSYDVGLQQLVKLYDPCEFNEKIILYGSELELKAVVVHIGDQQAGHYVMLVNRESDWYAVNDQTVKKLNEKQIQKDKFYEYFDYKEQNSKLTPYILLYQDSKRQEKTLTQKFGAIYHVEQKISAKNKLAFECKFFFSKDFSYFFQKLLKLKGLSEDTLRIFFHCFVYIDQSHSLIFDIYVSISSLIMGNQQSAELYMNYISKHYQQLIYVLTSKIGSHLKEIVVDLTKEAFRRFGGDNARCYYFISQLSQICYLNKGYFDFSYVVKLMVACLEHVPDPMSDGVYNFKLILDYLIQEKLEQSSLSDLVTDFMAPGPTNFSSLLKSMSSDHSRLRIYYHYFVPDYALIIAQNLKSEIEITNFCECISKLSSESSYLEHYLLIIRKLHAHLQMVFAANYFEKLSNIEDIFDEKFHDVVIEIIESSYDFKSIERILEALSRKNGFYNSKLLTRIRMLLEKWLSYFQMNLNVYQSSYVNCKHLVRKSKQIESGEQFEVQAQMECKEGSYFQSANFSGVVKKKYQNFALIISNDSDQIISLV